MAVGEIHQFVARLVATRDWSVAEQVRLLQLASELDRQAPGVEAVFGESDAGDPWCVIKDAEDNVLLHIARIGQDVIVHDVSAGLIQEGRDLWRLLADIMDDERPAAPGALAAETVVVDLQQERRNAHVLLALVVIQAFGLDVEAVFGGGVHTAEAAMAPSHAWEATGAAARDATEIVAAVHDKAGAPTSPEPAGAGAVTPVADDARPARAGDDEAAPVHASSSPPQQAEDPPAVTAPVGEAVQQIAPEGQRLVGGDGDDTLVGGAGTDLILGGLGDDVLSGGGAPAGTADVLDGGSGDDRIFVDPAVVAIGGKGADVFVVVAPPAGAGGDPELGVIVDFDASEGDILTFQAPGAVTILTATPQADLIGSTMTASSLVTASRMSGERLGIDWNGDGVEDGYLLVANVKVRIAAGAEAGGDPHADAASHEIGAPLVDVSQAI